MKLPLGFLTLFTLLAGYSDLGQGIENQFIFQTRLLSLPSVDVTYDL